MSVGDEFVNTLRQTIVFSTTRLHAAHQRCPICQKVTLQTLEQMIDHIESHGERVRSRVHLRDGGWIVLCEPSNYYTEHGVALPESLAHLTPTAHQERSLGLDPKIGSDLLEYTGLPSLRDRH